MEIPMTTEMTTKIINNHEDAIKELLSHIGGDADLDADFDLLSRIHDLTMSRDPAERAAGFLLRFVNGLDESVNRISERGLAGDAEMQEFFRLAPAAFALCVRCLMSLLVGKSDKIRFAGKVMLAIVATGMTVDD